MAGFRLGLVGLVVATLFLAMFARLWYLQVLDSPSFSQLAVQNQVRQVRDPAPRGLILDRQAQPLVDNSTTQAVTLSRQAAAAQPAVISRLAGVLGMTTQAVKDRLANTQFSVYRPVPIRLDVSTATVIYLREHQDQFPGVSTELLEERQYPKGATATQLLGHVGAISADQLKALANKGYQGGDQLGQDGVESTYEPWLRGNPGLTELAVDAQGKVVGTLSRRLPAPGDSVQLNLDSGLQQYTDQALAKEIQSLQGTYSPGAGYVHPPSGAAVVLDPQSGAVLAMSSYPTYDPSVWVGGISAKDYAALTDPNAHNPLVNNAIQGLYTPGSTFKLATATAALDTGLINPSSIIDDPGSFTIPGTCTGRCTYYNDSNEALGPIGLTTAIARSDDVFFYTLGLRFYAQSGQYGVKPIQDTANAYGLGEPTGVDLPSEVNGRVDSQAERQRLAAAAPGAFATTWYPADQLQMAFGQGATVVTPLQLADAYATFANGGTRYQPRVAAQVVSPNGKVVKAFPPVVTGHVPMSAANRQAMLAGFVGAVQGAGGTATGTFAGFDFSKLQVAGKTGTASTNHVVPDALFVAFAGQDIAHPQYVVAVVISQAGYGATGAAPVARQVLQYLADHPVAPVTPPSPPHLVVLAPPPTTTTRPPSTTSTTAGTIKPSTPATSTTASSLTHPASTSTPGASAPAPGTSGPSTTSSTSGATSTTSSATTSTTAPAPTTTAPTSTTSPVPTTTGTSTTVPPTARAAAPP